MKIMAHIFYSLTLLSLIILSSCGSDISTKIKTVNTSPLIGSECRFDSSPMPVCGAGKDGKLTDYNNVSYAICDKATNIFQGQCVCSSLKLVCMSSKVSLSECEAQEAIKKDSTLKITQFSDCSKQRFD